MMSYNKTILTLACPESAGSESVRAARARVAATLPRALGIYTVLLPCHYCSRFNCRKYAHIVLQFVKATVVGDADWERSTESLLSTVYKWGAYGEYTQYRGRGPSLGLPRNELRLHSSHYRM